MKLLKRLICIALTIVTLTGCNKDIADEGVAIAVEFSSSQQSGEDGVILSSGDTIGIYMVVTGSANLVVPIYNYEALNIPYEAISSDASSTKFAPASLSTIQYPADGTVVDFYAYYPYTTSGVTDGVYNIDVSSQIVDEVALCTAKVTAKSNKSPSVELPFTNQLTKLNLNLSLLETRSESNLDGLQATLKGYYTTANANLLSGDIYNRGDKADMELNCSDDGTSLEAVLIPSEAVEDSYIVFTLGDEEYIWNTSNIDFEAGMEMTYNVNINETPIVVGDVEILPWGEGASEELTPTPVVEQEEDEDNQEILTNEL